MEHPYSVASKLTEVISQGTFKFHVVALPHILKIFERSKSQSGPYINLTWDLLKISMLQAAHQAN